MVLKELILVCWCLVEYYSVNQVLKMFFHLIKLEIFLIKKHF